MHQSHTYRLPLSFLIISFILCSCWPSCKQDTDTVNPIRKQYKGQVFQDSILKKEIPTDILQSFPMFIAGLTESNLKATNTPPIITLDIEKGADIQGDAWDPGTISKIKAHDKCQGQVSVITFQRIGVLPLYWGKYLQAFCAQPSNAFYKLPDNQASLVQSSYRGMAMQGQGRLLEIYSQGLGFYHDLEKVPLSTLQLPITNQANLAINPQLVTLTTTQEGFFQNENPQIPQLEQLVNSVTPVENTVLKDYYELLAPGGLLIFMSSSSGVNRFGGIIVEYQGKKYTPFQDLDDPHMQAVYRSIFERAGFVDIKFYKDPCFMEDVIVLVAKKP
jgi:hypothetical protein